MAQIILHKRCQPNISVLVDNDVFNELNKSCWIDSPQGAISYKSRKKGRCLLSRKVFFMKNGFWPTKVYILNKNKYDCRIENLTNKCPFSQKTPNKKAFKHDFIEDRMIGTYYNKQKNFYIAYREYKGKRFNVCFSCNQLGYYQAKDLAESARIRLLSLNNTELETIIKNRRYRKFYKIGSNKVYKFTDIGYNRDGEFSEETVDNFIYNNSR